MKQTRAFRFWYLLLWPITHLVYPVRVRHRERLPQGAMVLCAPHSSMVDPVLLMMALGRGYYPRFMAKKELFEKPLLGKILGSMGVFPVDRGKPDLHAIRTAMEILRDGGTLGIFPEGTRVHTEATGSAHNGAVMLASRTGASLVPVWLTREKRLFRPVDVVIGEPYLLPRMSGGGEAYQPHAAELMERICALKGECGK